MCGCGLFNLSSRSQIESEMALTALHVADEIGNLGTHPPGDGSKGILLGEKQTRTAAFRSLRGSPFCLCDVGAFEVQP